jgi:flagellar motility protein MotE (MotC chaperone)
MMDLTNLLDELAAGLQASEANLEKAAADNEKFAAALEKRKAELEINRGKRQVILSQVLDLSRQVPLTREHLNKIKALYKDLESTPL